MVQVDYREDDTIVIAKRLEEEGQPLIVYRVEYEPGVTGEGGGFHWHYLGRQIE